MNYDIELPNPFWFGINIIESEEKLPSIGCNVDLRLELPRGKFSYSATGIWFECSVYDEFIDQLKGLLKGTASKAELYDIDREIVYAITTEIISVSVHRIHSEKGTGFMEFKLDYDSDLITQYIANLESFAKWW